MTFVDLCKKLEDIWGQFGCTRYISYDFPMGAGTFHPNIIEGMLTDNLFRGCSIQMCRRQSDNLKNNNKTNRSCGFHQYQVVIAQPPIETMNYFKKHLQLDDKIHDIHFKENNWNNPSIGAYGTGWEVLVNNMEIAQVTYFNQFFDEKLSYDILEFAIGIERLLMTINNVESFEELMWDHNILYQSIKGRSEMDFDNIYTIETLDNMLNNLQINKFYPSYEYMLYVSNIFNTLDAKNLITHLQRNKYMKIIRQHFKEIGLLLNNKNTKKQTFQNN